MPEQPAPRGQILVVFALAFISLVLVVGLVIDGSFGWVKNREAQNAADFAALAGARVVRLAQTNPSLSGGDVAQAVKSAAAANEQATVETFAYTDGNGQALGSPLNIDALISMPAPIPAGAAGVSVPNATLSWHPFFGSLLGISNWQTAAQATARFVLSSTAPPCGLCVLGGFSGSSSGNITSDDSILVDGSGTGSSSVQITSNHGSIVFANSTGASSSARLSAPNGDVWFDGDYKASSSSSISAPNGSVYITGDADLSSSGQITAGGAVMIGGDLTVKSSNSIDAGGSVSAGGNVVMQSSGKVTAGGSVTFGGNLNMSSSSRVTAQGSVSIGGNLNMSSSSRVTGSSVGYVGTYSCSGCNVSPAATKIGPVSAPSVPAVPAVEDPYADTTTYPDPAVKVKEAYPAYPALTPTTFSYSASSTGTINPTATEIASASVSSSSTGTFYPGVYKYIHCSSSARCYLNPGTYYFDGNASALDVASSTTLRSNGDVTLVFLNSSGIKLGSSADFDIDAPDAGDAASTTYPWPGFAIVFARDNTSTIEYSSSGSNGVTGIVYAPAATLKMSSSSSQSVTSTVVVGKFQGSSSSSITISSYGEGSSPEPGPLQLVK